MAADGRAWAACRVVASAGENGQALRLPRAWLGIVLQPAILLEAYVRAGPLVQLLPTRTPEPP